ncbi:MAG: hypothetical protein PUA76_03855 [Bacteroidales bacterium]|nr:hypothetical protein [Bacteroidales bacterium]
MKKFYIASLALLTVVSAMEAAPLARVKKAKVAKPSRKIERRAPSVDPIWRPVSQTDYMYEDDWMEVG